MRFGLSALLFGIGIPLPLAAIPLPTYEIVALGLTDASHTRSDGYRGSGASLLTESGYAAGTSRQFLGSNLGGTSPWLYDPTDATTTRLGLFDAAHTRSDGFQSSTLRGLTESGLATGDSALYVGGGSRSAWIHDASTAATTRLGYFDAAHTASNGTQVSEVGAATESGYAVGTSRRALGTGLNGASAWLYDRSTGTTTRLGFFDAAHTRNDGFQDSAAGANEVGDTAGASARFDGPGATFTGHSHWYQAASTGATTRVGLYDAEHTRNDGFQDGAVRGLSDTGYLTGTANRYTGAASLGRSAWLYDSSTATTTRLGYVDAVHTASDGTRESFVNIATGSGYIVGGSVRYLDLDSWGGSAWLHDVAEGTTTRIGLFDAAHVRSDGFQASGTTFAPTESGYVAGTSGRYAGATLLGNSAWLYDAAADTTTRIGLVGDPAEDSFAWRPTESGYVTGFTEIGGRQLAWLHAAPAGTTTQLGLYDAAHTHSTGIQFSAVTSFTESGFVAGLSRSYLVPSPGQSAWVYDASTDTQYSIILSARSDGYSFTNISLLTEEGLAIGQYLLHENDVPVGLAPFAWTASDGAMDLASLVEGGLTAAGWAYLDEPEAANELEQILGRGHLWSGDDLAYLLTPVPEPGTLALLLVAGLVGIARLRNAA